MPVPLFSTSQTMENVVMSFNEEEVDHSGEVFEAREIGTGPLDKKYERVPPEYFTAGSDDLFMKSMIMTYAVEHKNKDGTPNCFRSLRPPPRLLPLRFSRPIRASRDPPSLTTS